MSKGSQLPAYDVDLFAPDALRHPFEHYRRLRDMGPVVRLTDPDVYVLSRYGEVRDALRSSDTLISSKGVGFSEVFNTPRGPNLIASDGELHQRLKSHVLRPLLPAQLRQHRQMLRDMIGSRVKSLVDRGPFDAMAEIARLLPVAAISELVGLPEEGRTAMCDWAAATFNALGPPREGSEADFKLLTEAFGYLSRLNRDDVREGSWARTLFEAAAAGKLSEAEARGALSAFVLPSLDTTILAKGLLLYDLATSQDQWRLLKSDPSLVPNAVLEGVRHRSVLRWFSRVAVTDYNAGGSTIPARGRVMLIYASANLDERKFGTPDDFDITRDARDHLAWGVGVHMCGGMHLAKMEMEVLLEALIEHCGSMTAGEPELISNRGLYGYSRLPLELHSGTAH